MTIFISPSGPGRPAFLYCSYPSVSTVTSADTAAGLDPADILLATEDTYWQPDNQTGVKELVINFGTPMDFDHIAIAGENLDGVYLEVHADRNTNFSDYDVLSESVQITSETDLWAWRRLTGDAYQQVKLRFSGFSAAFRVAYVCFGNMAILPWWDEDPDPRGQYEAVGKHHVSHVGLYLGANQQTAFTKLNLAAGQITDLEYEVFRAWGEACIARMNPFFFVPDVNDESLVLFGYCPDNQKFSAPRVNGLRKMMPIAFHCRRWY